MWSKFKQSISMRVQYAVYEHSVFPSNMCCINFSSIPLRRVYLACTKLPVMLIL